ncbi:MAG: aminotransferase class I/II-fold pyridoxal phosphate-dependent enzyme, partial [Deltaproteobacteria bacterium]
AAAPEVVRLIENRARSFVFSTATAPSLAAAALTAAELVRGADASRAALLAHAAHLRAQLRALGYAVPVGTTPIVPVLLSDPETTVAVANALREHELSLGRTVANATAIALRNARILQSLRDQTQQISFARVEAERRLKALQRYADFFHSAADGILVIDADGQVLFSNPRAHEITGRSEAELGRGTFAGLVDPADLPRLSQIRAGFAQDEFPHMVDLSIRRQAPGGGDRRTLSVSFGSVLHEDGGAILVSFRDVTAERATEAELTKTKDFLERVIESSADAIVSADTTGLVLLYNRAAERTFGHPAAEVVGRRNARDLYPPGLARDIMRLIRSNEHGVPGRLEGYRTEVLSRDGTRIPVLLSAALILENGAPFGSVGVITDLRERLRMEARQQAQHSAEPAQPLPAHTPAMQDLLRTLAAQLSPATAQAPHRFLAWFPRTLPA